MAQLVYELTFKGAASETLAAAFLDCEVSTRHGATTVRSVVADQAALQGLIGRVHSLGLELLEVRLAAEPLAGDEAWATER
jgi:hypothetical protein